MIKTATDSMVKNILNSAATPLIRFNVWMLKAEMKIENGLSEGNIRYEPEVLMDEVFVAGTTPFFRSFFAVASIALLISNRASSGSSPSIISIAFSTFLPTLII